ncbi:MAG: peptidyl-prolyl cis-trans isomerase B (cyclophilin B) [Planctomycetota bacterium]|jgi:peptidyl-prolyl cis-trans isomerase B (cyclophilin B)
MTQDLTGTRVLVKTDAGDMTIEFLHDKAPGHVANFVKLAREGFYDGTRFHRVIPGFMIQGGDPNTKEGPRASWGTGGPGYQIKAEFNDVHHERGIFSMARSQDPDSAGSQFFLCHGDADFLDGQYTAFAQLVDGLETLDAIAGGACEPGGEGSSPTEPVQIQTMTVVEA